MQLQFELFNSLKFSYSQDTHYIKFVELVELVVFVSVEFTEFVEFVEFADVSEVAVEFSVEFVELQILQE